jgi:tetratricopeptide (TPR) repeat protein
MRCRVGRYCDALDDFACARAIASRNGDHEAEIEILLDEATALDWMGEYKSSELRAVLAKSLVPTPATPALEARVLLAVGRSAHRFNRDEEAAAMLERAAEQAERLGAEAYETLVIALLLLGFIHRGRGNLDAARRALDRQIALCEAHGDALHLGGAFNNRALLWACLGDKERMAADLERCIGLARALGQDALEFIGEFNFGEHLYLMDDAAAAAPHVRRAVELDRRRSGDAGRPVVALLEARLCLHRGDEAAAGAIVARIRARQAEAAEKGWTDMLMVPSEEVLCATVELATRGAEAAEWDDLEALSARFSVGHERIEVLEARACAALRRGRAGEAARKLEEAIEASSRAPNPMGERLARRLAEARSAAGLPPR